jgi:hypothetical protein
VLPLGTDYSLGYPDPRPHAEAWSYLRRTTKRLGGRVRRSFITPKPTTRTSSPWQPGGVGGWRDCFGAMSRIGWSRELPCRCCCSARTLNGKEGQSLIPDPGDTGNASPFFEPSRTFGGMMWIDALKPPQTGPSRRGDVDRRSLPVWPGEPGRAQCLPSSTRSPGSS